MPKKVNCKKHKFIGQRIEVVSDTRGLPVKCYKCGTIYFSDTPLRINKTAARKKRYICVSCAEGLRCGKCGHKFNHGDFYIAECFKCASEVFFCKKCSRKIFFLRDKTEPQRTAMLKLNKLLKEFMPDAGKNLPENINPLTHLKELNELPLYLMFYFNITVNGMDDDFDREDDDDDDDADWWKK
jgi:hypothetical protein